MVYGILCIRRGVNCGWSGGVVRGLIEIPCVSFSTPGRLVVVDKILVSYPMTLHQFY